MNAQSTGSDKNNIGGRQNRTMKQLWPRIWLAVVLFGIMIMFGVISHASWQNSNSSATADPASAAAIYNRQCASCHGKDGRAKTLRGKLKDARDLTNWQWQDRVSDEQLYNSIMN